jgi:ComF family protein
MKYHRLESLAQALGRQAGRIVRQQRADNASLLEPDTLLVPVPLHRSRYRERGFNQSLLIAQEIAVAVSAPGARELLRRQRHTITQTRLSRAERKSNLACAFEALADLSGLRICLVDDVVTTGATLVAAAAALRVAGALDVCAITIAHSDDQTGTRIDAGRRSSDPTPEQDQTERGTQNWK